MGATAGWPTASARRANALVIGRWCGVAALFYPLTWQLFTHPNLRAVAALGSAALVAAVNFLQRHFLVSLQANAGETSRAALRTQASLVTRIRALGRVLLALDAALVVLAALALADEPSGGFWALLGWLPVEGAIAEGTVTAVITGTLAVGAVIAYDAVARGGMPSFSPGSGLLVRVLELAGVTGVMIGLERTLSKGERIMTQRHDELTGLIDREREARAELEAFSTIVLAGVAHQGNRLLRHRARHQVGGLRADPLRRPRPGGGERGVAPAGRLQPERPRAAPAARGPDGGGGRQRPPVRRAERHGRSRERRQARDRGGQPGGGGQREGGHLPGRAGPHARRGGRGARLRGAVLCGAGRQRAAADPRRGRLPARGGRAPATGRRGGHHRAGVRQRAGPAHRQGRERKQLAGPRRARRHRLGAGGAGAARGQDARRAHRQVEPARGVRRRRDDPAVAHRRPARHGDRAGAPGRGRGRDDRAAQAARPDARRLRGHDHP